MKGQALRTALFCCTLPVCTLPVRTCTCCAPECRGSMLDSHTTSRISASVRTLTPTQSVACAAPKCRGRCWTTTSCPCSSANAVPLLPPTHQRASSSRAKQARSSNSSKGRAARRGMEPPPSCWCGTWPLKPHARWGG